MATRDYIMRRPEAAAVRMKHCDRCSRGWVTFCNEVTPIGRASAQHIRTVSGLAYVEQAATVAILLSDGVLIPGQVDASREPAERVTAFRFAAGQPCFQHPAPPRFYAGGREHVRLADWAEDLTEHLGRLEEQRKKG